MKPYEEWKQLVETERQQPEHEAFWDAYFKKETEAYRAESERLGGQLEVNKEEARHASVFVAGWRPAVGWVSVIALAYQFILYPLLVWGWNGMQAAGWIAANLNPPTLLDVEALMVLITGMLGIAGARTWEKLKGATK